MKRGDYIVILTSIIIIAILFFAVFGFTEKGNVEITQNGELVHKAKLTQDSEFVLDDNTVVIKNGEVYMKAATCKNQVCVKHKPINKKGETIVCLPNKVIVAIK